MIADLIIRLCLWLARNRAPELIPDRKIHRLQTQDRHGYAVGDTFGTGGWTHVVTKVLSPYELEAAPVYLTRYFLTKRSRETQGMEEGPPKRPRWGLYLHRFSRSDHDAALHSHPWRWAVSLVLKNGYEEERRTGRFAELNGRYGPTGKIYEVIRRDVRPWTLNFLRGEDFHRVDLMWGEAWTLFLVGPLHDRSWGFWDRETGRYTGWKKFLGVEK